MIKNAIFLDRDGTIIHDNGYLTAPEQVVFFDNTFKALKMLRKKFELFIITNQSGIAKGFQTQKQTDTVNQHITRILAEKGIKIRHTYVCPHERSDNCSCIKPNPYFVHQAAADFGISPTGSYSIGDHPHDAELAKNFGGTGIYVLTGHGAKHIHETRSSNFLAKDILNAAEFICKTSNFTCHYCSAFEASNMIKKGETAIIPTETVYGLGCSAFDSKAAEKVFKLKKRPVFDPLIVYVCGLDMLPEVAEKIPEKALRLAEKFWPGPLTFILPKTKKIPDLVTAGLKTVAVRMPAHPVALKIIRESGCPVAAPSANMFGSLSPTTAENARRQFNDSVKCIVDGGPCQIGIESTIIDFSGKIPKILRQGAIPEETLNEELEVIKSAETVTEKHICPGSMTRHYSPRTRLVVNTPGTKHQITGKIGRIIFGCHAACKSENIENLSPDGDLNEAAKNLYSALARLDTKGLDLIVADLVPEKGIGKAVNDRLRKASAQK